jgi:hypothetical protein
MKGICQIWIKIKAFDSVLRMQFTVFLSEFYMIMRLLYQIINSSAKSEADRHALRVSRSR